MKVIYGQHYALLTNRIDISLFLCAVFLIPLVFVWLGKKFKATLCYDNFSSEVFLLP